MSEPILSARGLVLTFVNRFAGGWRRHLVRAVDEVDLDIHEGETLAIVGESGSGKSSLAKLLLSLVRPTRGDIRYRGEPIAGLAGARRRAYRRDVQAVFQDPAASLNPRIRVERTLAHVLLEHGLANSATVRGIVAEELRAVGLTEQFMARYPHQLSGGQQQRIAIARAMALRPRLIIADEPLSSLDISVQTQILELMAQLKREKKIGFVIISHDLAAVQSMADRIAVMYRGHIVEIGNRVLARPLHPYTQALVDAKLIANPRIARARKRIVLAGDAASAPADGVGCCFRTRCPLVRPVCHTQTPALRPAGPHEALVACHLAGHADIAVPSGLYERMPG